MLSTRDPAGTWTREPAPPAGGQGGGREGPGGFGDDAVGLVHGEHLGAHLPLGDAGQFDLRLVDDVEGVVAHEADRGTVDEGVDVVQRERSTRGDRGRHARRPVRFHPDDPHLRVVGAQPGRGTRHQTPATDGQDHDVRHEPELLDGLRDGGALPGGGAGVVEGGYEDAAVALREPSRGPGGLVVGGALHHQLDVTASQRLDTVAFLPGRGGGNVDNRADTQRRRRERDPLPVVAGRRAHHTGVPRLGRELRDQVVGAPQLVGTHGLEILAFQPHLGSGVLRESLVQFDGGDAGHSFQPVAGVGNEGSQVGKHSHGPNCASRKQNPHSSRGRAPPRSWLSYSILGAG